MAFTKYLVPLWFFLAVVSAQHEPNIGKRSLLDSRQVCPDPSFVPICPGPFECVPPGAVCCSDGISYGLPSQGIECPSGTQPLTSAAAPPPPSTITSAATTSTAFTVTSYSFFTTEIIWYYYYYYFTYIALYSTTSLASTQITTTTTVSVSATNSIQASALFAGLSATLPTPTQSTTSLSGPAAPATSAVLSTATTPLSVLPTTVESTSAATTSAVVQFTGAASQLRAGIMMPLVDGGLGLWMVGAGIVLPGLVMLWLLLDV